MLPMTNYLQLLLYISHEQSDLYMIVTAKAFLLQGKGESEHGIVRAFRFNDLTASMIWLLLIPLCDYFHDLTTSMNKYTHSI